MILNNNIIIRKYSKKDRKKVRQISYDTAFLGLRKGDIFDNEEIISDFLTNYFINYEPGSCFVAESAGEVIGYVVGALDTEKMKKILGGRIIPLLIAKILRKKLFVNRTNLNFFLRVFRSFAKGEFFTPEFSKYYPATLHINIDENFRGRKIGTKLLEHYIEFLNSRGCVGVHFGTMSEAAKDFFISRGFSILHEGVKTYLKPYTGRNYPYYILGKKIKNGGDHQS